MKRILVTGGAGVIGMELVPKLLERGYTVWVGDLKPKPAHFDERVLYRQGDLNTLSVEEANAFAPDVVMHLAATFERSVETPGFWGENFRHNVSLSHHIMTVAQKIETLKRVVFASSYLIYEPDLYQFDTVPEVPRTLTETDPIEPRNLTGMAKLSHEIELRFLAEQEQTHFSIACIRIFRGYGRNSRDVISRWTRALLAGEGIDVYNPEGMFDYLYARDSAEGLIRAAEQTRLTGIVNLGTGRSRKVSDVINVLRSHFPDMQVTEHARVPPVERSQADLTRWSAQINWRPEIELEQAIAEIIEFERARKEAADDAQPPLPSVLVTSASAKIPLLGALRDALNKLGSPGSLWAGDVDAEVLARHVADHFWLMPRLDELNLAEFIKACHHRGIGTIIPTRDGELAFWASQAHTLGSHGIAVIVSPEQSVGRCLDKLAFAQFGKAQGLPFIPAALTMDGLGEPSASSGRFTVKERYGAGSFSLGMNLSGNEAIEHASKLNEPLFQPFVVGRECSVDAWMDNTGLPKGVVMRWRDKVVNGESQVTTTFSDDALERLFVTILQSLDLRGPAVLQAIVDEQGQVHVIECNSRFGGASTTAIAAGLDSFYWSLLERQGVNLAQYPFARTSGEIRQVRMPCDSLQRLSAEQVDEGENR